MCKRRRLNQRANPERKRRAPVSRVTTGGDMEMMEREEILNAEV